MRHPEETYVDIGDAKLCVWRWPTKDQNADEGAAPILMVHATGFHGRCWDAVAEQFPDNPVYAVDLRFHGRSSDAGTVSWPLMADDISKLVEMLDLKGAIGVGHSIGGYLLTLVAVGAPDRFRELVLLDPVIMSHDRYEMAKAMEAAVKPEDHPGAKRFNAWSGAEEMVERYRERKPFNRWQPRVLEDFCAFALAAPDEDGVHKLLCEPLNEVQIYIRHNGDRVHAAIPNVQAPTTIVRAREPGPKDTMFDFSVSPTWPALAGAYPNARDIYLPEHTHFIPMEAPELVAAYIRDALKGDWQQKK